MASERPVVTYLKAVHLIHATQAGTRETSFYGPLENLLNAVGEKLKPKVRAVFHLQDIGAGHPDFGLFTDDQFSRRSDDTPRTGQQPARGAGEVKSADETLTPILAGTQVSRYWKQYKQVLVTNLREFAFISEDDHGRPVVLEHHSLADSAGAFWAMAAQGSRLKREDEEATIAFLERCMRHAAPIDEPRDLAWFLASYAREARSRLDRAPLETLADLREDLENALGARFAGDRGERFFRATVVQTLFYGIFSAWTLWHRENPDREDTFAWRGAIDYLRLPVMEALYHRLTGPTLRALGLMDLLDRTTRTLARVHRDRFFDRFKDAEAIQYFYEPFLEAYDPALRKELGVWYTPPELVRYMVSQVDRSLREDLGVADGLADENVIVLDPACGTGAFLVETLRHIGRTLQERGEGAIAAEKLKRASISRLYGFELLTAPFVVAHLQIGLALRTAGAPLADHERAAIYLTNSLTDWTQTVADTHYVMGNEFADEVEQARRIKRKEPILVVIGNPPYDGYAGFVPYTETAAEERALVDAYRTSTRTDLPRPQGQGLNDLYVRFFRIAERQIAERTGRGIVCYVSNNSWLDGLSHPFMRDRFMKAFDLIRIDNLHGDKYRTGKLTPEGLPDPSVFSTPHNREGIQVGAAVALLTRTDSTGALNVQYRDFWGVRKRDILNAIDAGDDSLSSIGVEASTYQTLIPEPALGLPFLPRTTGEGYLDWPALNELFPQVFAGITTACDDFLIDIDKDVLTARVSEYFDPEVPNSVIEEKYPRAMRKTPQFDPDSSRRALQKRGMILDEMTVYAYRPFDNRHLFWIMNTNIIDRKRLEYAPHVNMPNLIIALARKARRSYDSPQIVTIPGDYVLCDPSTNYFPLYLAPDLETDQVIRTNLSSLAKEYLERISGAPEDLFYHALAVMHTPSYSEANTGALKQSWPRIPLPEAPGVLSASAELGRRVAALLDSESAVPGVTSGAIRPELRIIAQTARVGGGQLATSQGDFGLTERWGYKGHTGQVMPAKGRLTEHPRPAELPKVLGNAILSVHMNDRAYWSGVPDAVWNYTLGGYQVLKKWLSYRTTDILGRDLRLEEVEHFTHTARRIAALVLMGEELDENYARAKGDSTLT